MQITLMAIAWQGPPAVAGLLHEIESFDRGIAAEAIDSRDLRTRLDACPPDVLLVEFDATHPDSAWDVLVEASRLSPGTKTLLLCEDFSPAVVLEFIRHGTSGCVLRSSTPEFLSKAVRTVHAGEKWFGRSDLLEALRSQLAIGPLRYPPDHPSEEHPSKRGKSC